MERALVKIEDFMCLPEYSTTLPTGTQAGKVWRRLHYGSPSHWRLGVYGEAFDHPIDGRVVSIYWFDAEFEELPPGSAVYKNAVWHGLTDYAPAYHVAAGRLENLISALWREYYAARTRSTRPGPGRARRG